MPKLPSVVTLNTRRAVWCLLEQCVCVPAAQNATDKMPAALLPLLSYWSHTQQSKKKMVTKDDDNGDASRTTIDETRPNLRKHFYVRTCEPL